MDNNVKYRQFVSSEFYPLFNYVVDDYKKTLLEKIISADDKDKVWEYKQAISALNKFQTHISYMANENKEE